MDERLWLSTEACPVYIDWTVWKRVVLVPQVISEHLCTALWLGGCAAMGPICGLSEDDGHITPERFLRGSRRGQLPYVLILPCEVKFCIPKGVSHMFP